MALQDPNIMPSSRLDCPLSLKTPNMGNTGINDFISIGTVFLILHYTILLRMPMEILVHRVEELQRATASIVRIQELFETKRTVEDGKGMAFPDFYLRDVPSGAINNFDLKLTEDLHGEKATVRITGSSIDISAHSPVALTQAAKHYLASPALAHID